MQLTCLFVLSLTCLKLIEQWFKFFFWHFLSPLISLQLFHIFRGLENHHHSIIMLHTNTWNIQNKPKPPHILYNSAETNQ